MKAENRLFYKVTAKESRQQISSVVNRAGAVIYRSRKWTSPLQGCGPLCVFDTFQAASEFRWNRLYQSSSIWLCEIHPSKAVRVWNEESSCCLGRLPAGTVLADKVKLVKQVLSPSSLCHTS